MDDEWHLIGYIVREALDSVRNAIASHSITEVNFAWGQVQDTMQALTLPGMNNGVQKSAVLQALDSLFKHLTMHVDYYCSII